MSRSSRHLVKLFEKYALLEMTSNVSHYYIVSLLEIQVFVVPPNGQDDLENLQSIFEVDHLRESLTFLDTQCAYPASNTSGVAR